MKEKSKIDRIWETLWQTIGYVGGLLFIFNGVLPMVFGKDPQPVNMEVGSIMIILLFVLRTTNIIGEYKLEDRDEE
jgi:uncharacterized membrane protein